MLQGEGISQRLQSAEEAIHQIPGSLASTGVNVQKRQVHREVSGPCGRQPGKVTKGQWAKDSGLLPGLQTLPVLDISEDSKNS